LFKLLIIAVYECVMSCPDPIINFIFLC